MGTITTIAGNRSERLQRGTGGQATSAAKLDGGPYAVAVDGSGILYIV